MVERPTTKAPPTSTSPLVNPRHLECRVVDNALLGMHLIYEEPFLNEHLKLCSEEEDAGIAMLDVRALREKAVAATVPLTVMGRRFKGAFTGPTTILTAAHGCGYETGRALGREISIKFADEVLTGFISLWSEADDICELITTEECRTLLQAKVLAVNHHPDDVFVGVHYKGAERLTKVRSGVWESTATHLGPGDSGAPVLDHNGRWVCLYVGITPDGKRIYRAPLAPANDLFAAALRWQPRGEPKVYEYNPHKSKGKRRPHRMTQAEYEKRRAAAERHVGRTLTSKELNAYFFHDDHAQAYISKYETMHGTYAVQRADDDENHHYVDDDDDQPVYGQEEEDAWDHDEAIGGSVSVFMFGKQAKRKGYGGVTHNYMPCSEPAPKDMRLTEEDEEMEAREPAPSTEPDLFPAPWFLPASFREVWPTLPVDEKCLLLMDVLNISEISRKIYDRFPPSTRYNVLCDLKRKETAAAMAAVTATTHALTKPPTKKDAADQRRKEVITSLERRVAELNAEGFRLRDTVTLSEKEMKEWPAVTHPEMLLRKTIKRLENAKSAKANYAKQMAEREKMAAKANAQLARMTSTIAELKQALDDVESERGTDF